MCLSGVYVINGTFGGRPVYVEQRKFDGTPFEVKTGAVIKFARRKALGYSCTRI